MRRKTYFPKFIRSDYVEILRKEAEISELNTDAEVEYALKMLDPNQDGKISFDVLLQCMKIFYPKLGQKEYEFLLGKKDSINVSYIKELLSDSSFKYNPVKESFRVMNPKGSGYVDTEFLKEFLSNLGFGKIDESDFEAIMSVADVDGDGKISLQDWENMVENEKSKEIAEEEVKEEEEPVLYDDDDSD